MRQISTYWLGFLAVSFASTVVTATFIQARNLKRYGLRVFRRRSMFDTYWRELAPWERLFLWPGFFAFLVSVIWGVAVAPFL